MRRFKEHNQAGTLITVMVTLLNYFPLFQKRTWTVLLTIVKQPRLFYKGSYQIITKPGGR